MLSEFSLIMILNVPQMDHDNLARYLQLYRAKRLCERIGQMGHMDNMIIEILKNEVRPAMGCTEPVAVVLGAAKTRALLGTDYVDYIDVKVSPNFYKNGLSVGIPQTDQVGLDMASAIGAAGGDAELGLEILSSVDEEVVEKAKEYLSQGIIKLSIADTEEKVLVDVTMRAGTETAQTVIRGHHDAFVYMKKNDAVLLEVEKVAGQTENKYEAFFNLSVKEMIQQVENMSADTMTFLKEGIEMNLEVADAGLEKALGMGVGYAVKKQIEDGVLENSLQNKAMMLTAAASDARMSGITKPVMSSNGSGNNGLTAILPIAAYASMHEISEEKLIKALAISHLLNTYMKNFIGRLSAICSCAVSAATGSGAAITWLEGGSYKEIEDTIQNMIGNLSGLICDGAKDSCALKLATAANTGVQMSNMARYGVVVPARNGIVASRVEQSIRNLGRIASEGMNTTDSVILSVMKDMADEALQGQNI